MIFNKSFVIKKLLDSPIEAIIFDCDGILVDTEFLKYKAWCGALREIGINNYKLADHVVMVGLESRSMLKKLNQKFNKELPLSVIQRKRQIYDEIKNDTKPMRSMVKIVKKLFSFKDDLHIKLGLASGEFEKNIHHNLETTGLENIFEAIVSGSDHLSAYSNPDGVNKPKPYIYLEAAKRLGVSPTKCIAIEDTPVGVQAAHDAGMKVIAVPNKYSKTGNFCKANYVYSDGPLTFKGLIKNIISLAGDIPRME